MPRLHIRHLLSAYALLTSVITGATGTVAADNYLVVHAFRDDGSGEHPWAGVLRATDGSLFGTTAGGGGKGLGTVFRLKPPANAGGTYKRVLLHAFTGGKDGAAPLAGLVAGPGGAYFGVTESGGGGACSGGCGTIFRLAPTTSGGFAYSVVGRFATATGGARPSGRLAVRYGRIYGTTSAGGAFEGGTLWELRRAGDRWTRATLHPFRGGVDDGRTPRSGVTLGPDGALYGTTEAGGSDDGGLGTVFRFAIASRSVTLLHRFAGETDGEKPIAPVAFDAHGALYGSTPYGGIGSCFLRCGTVFKIAKSGTTWTARTIYRFRNTGDGSFPRGSLVLDGNGRVFGTASAGGLASSSGVVFRLAPPQTAGGAWQRKIIHSFAGPPDDGAVPFGGLSKSGGAIWGTTRDGGTQGAGTVFRFTP